MGHKQKAWLVIWDWAGLHAAVEDRLAAILRPRLTARIVKEIVECPYALHAYTPGEIAAWAKNPKQNPYPANWEAGICFCGHNPFLTAQYVHDLSINKNPQSGLESISYVLPARYKFNTVTRNIEIDREALKKSFTRSITGPLSHREIGRYQLDTNPTEENRQSNLNMLPKEI
ncbi:MAG: hypothetical protein R3B95_01655 [Nitrospirales bacterium]|nr:hypothetical protein [Nitrospirales bacterium]